jgi:CheY-like chemotaxis protein
VKPGRFVKVTVSDTGIGIDKKDLGRVFEPFFTTKEMGRGTGLGLASAYGIVKSHGGHINVYSEKDHGTTFNFYLPASLRKAAAEVTPAPPAVRRGRETVLLIDDEEMIIDVGCGLLRELGYTVFPARSGHDALDIYRERHAEIDIIVMDMIMPGLSGGETFDRLKQINPRAKVLLSSGYSINGQASQIMERGCDGFIQKPFNLQQLSAKLRFILGDETPPSDCS